MALNPWLLGRHVTAVQLQVQTLNESTGALADAVGATQVADLVVSTGSHSAGTILFTTGLLDSIRLSSDKTTENIASVDRKFANHIPLRIGYQASVAEILRQGANNCRLAQIYHNGSSKIVKLTYARGGNRWIDYFLITGYTETLQRGKNIGTMTLMSVDNGGGTYTANDR